MMKTNAIAGLTVAAINPESDIGTARDARRFDALYDTHAGRRNVVRPEPFRCRFRG